VVTRAKTSDNAANLDAGTLRYYHDKYGGTRLGRQELVVGRNGFAECAGRGI
jgi:phage terminase large subunit-like protein